MVKVAKTKEEKLRLQLQALFALMGSGNPAERETARQKIDELLARYRKTWADLTELMKNPAAVSDWEAAWDDTGSDEQHAGDAINRGLPVKAEEPPNIFELVHHILERHNGVQPHERVATALWTLHTHVYKAFDHTPRLALLSPIRGCGKSTLLYVLEKLVNRPERMDNCTAPVLFRLADRVSGATLLIDEADNLGMGQNGILRSVINAHRRDANVRRVIKGADKEFKTYTPMAIAAIGSLPLPMMRRSIIIHMQRATIGAFERFDTGNPEIVGRINAVYGFVSRWARTKPTFNSDPLLPPQLGVSAADNWRSLISIADSLGAKWGTVAREAAVTFARSYHDEDIAVVLLADIKIIFDRTGADRMFSEDLVAMLLEIEESGWSEYRGMHDDRYPRRLTKEELARLLKLFQIRPKTIWPLKRRKDDRSRKGYYRSDFEAAWRAYVDEPAGTPSQRSEIRLISSRSD